MPTYKLTITGRAEPLLVVADTEQEALASAYDEIQLYGKSGDIELVSD